MKIAVLTLLLASSALAQQPVDPATTSCGPAGVQIHVHLDKHPPAPQPPEPGKARVYFIQEAGNAINLAYPTTRVGLDGAWAGALRPNSYFAASVVPGEHHVCAVLHSLATGTVTELAQFSAGPGKTYYYRSRLILMQDRVYLELQPVDSDEARHLIASDPLTIASPR
jgi:hypothetical protein